jgi:hypothetical protein
MIAHCSECFKRFANLLFVPYQFIYTLALRLRVSLTSSPASRFMPKHYDRLPTSRPTVFPTIRACNSACS